jgi:carbamoyltransferase
MIALGFSGYTRDSRQARRGRGLGMTGLGFDRMVRFVDGEVPARLFPLSFFGHDAAAAIVVDSEVVACAAEERFTRVKHGLNVAGNPLLPRNAIAYCLDAAGARIEDVDVVAHYCDFTDARVDERLSLMAPYMRDGDAPCVAQEYRDVYETMMSAAVVAGQFERMTGAAPKAFVKVPHHMAHAGSAYLASGFDEAVILTIDGAGEIESSLLAVGHQGSIEPIRRYTLPTSLGTLYLMITVYLGFRSLDDEYKVMGLASYGNPRRYSSFFDRVVQLTDDGGYSTAAIAEPDFGAALVDALGPPRARGDAIEQRHADVAAALQRSVEGAVLNVLRHARDEIGLDYLCLAGGVALNCAMNGAIARSCLFRRIFVQPASSDEGCAVGAALYAGAGSERGGAAWTHTYFGPGFNDAAIDAALDRVSGRVRRSRPTDPAARAAVEIARGRVHAWFQGRMEFGPRALGNRSILADPRDPHMRERVNRKVKKREPFRPFAPAVLEEEAQAWFDMGPIESSPFMLFTFEVRDAVRSLLPAVTHVDGTARVQTVSREVNPIFWRVIDVFKSLTGVPVVLNTSFNVRNEPIVCTPEDALRCFLSTDIDSMTIGRCLVEKRE